MPRSTFPVLVLSVLWLLQACRTVPNPDYCEQPGDCADRGEGWTCNVEENQCIPPSGAECTSDAQCLLDIEPICGDEQTCRACASSQECRDKNRDTPFCSPSGACTAEEPPECVDSDDCTDSPTAPICDQVAGECKSCNDVDDETACMMRSAGSAPYCAPDGSCVVCLDNTHCDASAPVCDPDAKTCGACKEHSDCAAFSGVCGDDGACADESTVVYLEKTGMDSGDCTKSAPCLSLPYARDKVQADNTNKQFIRILDVDNYAGATGGALTLSNIDVAIIASGATLTSIDNNRPIIDVGSGTDLTLSGVTVRASGTGVDGLRCQASDSRVRLDKVIVDGNQGIGVNVSGGCELVIQRSVISNNLNGGIKISDAAFSITNSYITDNGSAAALFGGIQILNGLTAATQVLAFNTILDNVADDSADSRGVHCTLPGASPLRATSNIVRGGTGGTALLKRDNCDWVHSNIEEIPADLMVVEKNNIDDPCNIAPGAGDLPRIDAASMCKDAGEPGTGILVDYDGEPRPDGSGADQPDMGADEIVETP